MIPMEARRYTKKPVEIEAVQLTTENVIEVMTWCGGTATGGAMDAVCIIISTKEGEMRADIGDYVIKEPFPTGDRDFYPCKASIFEATYDTGGGLRPKAVLTSDLKHILRSMADSVELGDSFGGSIEYDALDPDLPPGHYLVKAVWRVGNSEGQGSVNMIGDVPG